MQPASSTLRIGGGGCTVSSWIGRHSGGITSHAGLLLGGLLHNLGVTFVGTSRNDGRNIRSRRQGVRPDGEALGQWARACVEPHS